MRGLSFQALAVSAFVTLSFSAASAACIPAPDGVGNICGPSIENGITAEATATHGASSKGRWVIQTDTSPMDDSKSVFAMLESQSMIMGRYGGPMAPAMITMRCMENTTAVIFTMNDQFLSDIQGYGVIEYRVDDKKATSVNAEESTDNRALGLWSGRRAIPFIKGLFGAERLTIRITPFNESPMTMEFDIRNTEEAAAELRRRVDGESRLARRHIR